MTKELSEFELDALREVIAIGAGSASTSLSVMAKKRVVVSFPSIILTSLEKMPQLFGEAHEIFTSVFLNITGHKGNNKFPVGFLLFLLKENDAVSLANMLTGEKSKTLSELGISALEETGNILSGSGLHAISKFLHFKIIESLPDIKTDMLNAVLDTLINSMAKKAQKIFVFNTNFSIEDKNVNGGFIFLFDPDITESLLAQIKRYKPED